MADPWADSDNLQRAVDLVIEFTEENKEKNFEEALMLCNTHENKFKKAQKEDRNINYEESRHLYESGIEHFRQQEQYELESMLSENEINKAVVYCIFAVKEDRSHNYEKAMNLYEKGIVCIRRALDYDVKTEEVKEFMRNKMKQYEDRAEGIKTYLRQLKMKELENVTKSDIFEEQNDIQCCRIC